MLQRNDEEDCKKPRLSFSPASSVWGPMGRPWMTIGRSETRTMEKITEADYVAFFISSSVSPRTLHLLLSECTMPLSEVFHGWRRCLGPYQLLPLP
jgi:hypothetical protein